MLTAGRTGIERIKALMWGIGFTSVLAVLIVIGSRNLDHFDAALVGYTFAVLFATFAITYRYAMWLQRPPTALYWRRGWQVFFSPRYLPRNIVAWFRRVIFEFGLNSFIAQRGVLRWLAHWLIMWGCILAFAITFPLVFGWIHFETVPGKLDWYTTYVFGFPAASFPIHSPIAFLTFHGLVWASFLVIAGVMVAMRRRMRDHGAAAQQNFGEDFLPLILLWAISVTGLLLTASYTWMDGYGYEFLALLHAVVVIFTLLWLPFGKFFHIFQRPAQLGVGFYKDIGAREGMAKCARCGGEYASKMHVEDLIEVERALGYRYEMNVPAPVGVGSFAALRPLPGSSPAQDDSALSFRASPAQDDSARPFAATRASSASPAQDDRPVADHYQRICPPCRRSMLAIAQGRLFQRSPFDSSAVMGDTK